MQIASERNQCCSGSFATFSLNVGNLISSTTIELALGIFNEQSNGGILSCMLVAVLALSVLIALSGDESLDLTSGDTPGVV